MARGSIASRPFLKHSIEWYSTLIGHIRERDRTNLNCNDPDRYLTIENCRINFNNQAGLLSSMTHEQLYTNSVLSGIRNMTFDEFTGLTLSVSARGNGESAPLQHLAGLGSRMTPAGNGILGMKLVSTIGPILVSSPKSFN